MQDRPEAPETPQEKKARSCARDRRHCYGENSTACTAMPRRKAGENRRDRRHVAQSLAALLQLDEAAAAAVERSARHDVNRVGGWRRSPDLALGAHVARQAARRAQQAGAVPPRTTPAADGRAPAAPACLDAAGEPA